MNPMLYAVRYFSLSVLLFVAGCSSSTGHRNIDELKSAPKSLNLGGNIYTLEASVWRDLMPTIDTSLNKGINVSLKLSVAGNFPQGDSMKVQKIYLLNKDSMCEIDSLVMNISGGKMKEITARNGLPWEPGSKVTAVLEFKYAGKNKLISSGETEIKAVY